MTKTTFALALTVVLSTGCAITNETTLVVGRTRPQISADAVKIYTTPPAAYEEIALVSADATHAFMTKQDLLNISVLKIKTEAAKVGANGVLLDSVSDTTLTSSAMVMQPARKGAPQIGFIGGGSSTGKALSGKAIFVPD